MGQQQLLFLVLCVAVVGIAVVAGFQVYGEQSVAAKQQAAVDGAMSIVARIQAWKVLPEAVGGGAGSTPHDFSDITFLAVGYDTSKAFEYVSTRGCYRLHGAPTGAILEVHQVSSGAMCDEESLVGDVFVSGPGVEDIVWHYR